MTLVTPVLPRQFVGPTHSLGCCQNWVAAGAQREATAAAKDSRFKPEQATHGLPRNGQDWFAQRYELPAGKLGWVRLHGVDSACVKGYAKLSIHVCDLAPAGESLALRQERAALQREILPCG